MLMALVGAGIMAAGFIIGFIFAVVLGASLKSKEDDDG